ncbi:GtrA family protein [Xanthomonas sp. 60]
MQLSRTTKSSILRFLASGAANTACTYVLYLALLRFVDYRISYTTSYLAGIVLAYVLNRFFVFRSSKGWRSVALFPLVYAAQYIAGILITSFWVEAADLPRELAPLAAIFITIPMTFLMSRLVFGNRLKEVKEASKRHVESTKPD